MDSLDMISKIQELCQDVGVSVNKMLTDLTIGTNLLTNMRTRGTIPSAETVSRIASYFYVPTKFLMCEPPFDKWDYIKSHRAEILLSMNKSLDKYFIIWGGYKEILAAGICSYISFLDHMIESISIDPDAPDRPILTLKSTVLIEQNEKPATVSGNELSDSEYQLLQLFRLIPPEKQLQVLGIIRQNLELAGLLKPQA